MYYLIIVAIIFVLGFFIFRHKKDKNAKSFAVLLMIVTSLIIGFLGYSLIPFIAPVREIIEYKNLTPISFNIDHKGNPEFVGQVHKRGADGIIYSIVEDDGFTHLKLAPKNASVYYENEDIVPIKKGEKQKSNTKAPYVEITHLRYKDTIWNRVFFFNSNQPVNKDVNSQYRFYLPTNNNYARYVLDY